MKRWIGWVCMLLMVAFAANAQTKVIERSSKKAPAWLNMAVDDYLIVTVTANSLAEAQNKTLAEISERIILSVASNVTVSTRNELSEVNVNGDITSTDNFSRLSRMASANLPFLKGISLSNVEEVYWVKVQDKVTKKEHYEYSVKYPFTRIERRRLIAEFERIDAEKVAQYEALEQKINEIERIEEIKDATTQLETLEEYFFDEVRLSQVRGLKARYNELYNTLTVTGMFIEAGKYQCQVLLGGNPVSVPVAPKVTSNCAGQLSVLPVDGQFVISYDAVDCLPDEENFLHILFRINGKRVEHKAYLKESGGATVGSFSVVPEGKLILTADSVVAADRKLFNLNIRLTLNNRSAMPFGLKALELHIPELTTPIVFDDIDLVYKTKGVLQIKLRAEGTFTVREVKKSAFSFAQGSITLVNPQTGAIERKQLSLPYVSNWE